MIYTVEGSEDGLILATTNARTAAAKVVEYIEGATYSGGDLVDALDTIRKAVHAGEFSVRFTVDDLDYGTGISVTVTFW